MKFHAPKSIYGPNLLRLFIDDLGGVKAVYQYLQVTEKTVLNWLATGRVPRSVVLALYWESKYGQSLLNSRQQTSFQYLHARIRLLTEQYQRAKDMVTGLRSLHSGSANDPLFEELPDAPCYSQTSFATPEELELFAGLTCKEEPFSVAVAVANSK